MNVPPGPFKIPTINDYIPEKMKPWVFIFILLVIQLSGGGIYLATLNETVGDRALLREDVTMAGFASLVGMALIFAIMLRLKMRIQTKYALVICGAAIIICNLIALETNNLFVLITVCFFSGAFKMWATFECNSSIQLWITPSRDLPVFFAYIYLLVNGVILLGGATDMYVSLLSNYKFVNFLIIGALLFTMLLVMLIFNTRRIMPNLPLFGIDWLGAIIWGLIMLCINFICIYFEYFDGFKSAEIQTGILFLVILLALNIFRASFIRHPFISLETFTFKPVWHTLIIYLLVDILIAPSHVYEHIFFESVLGYDTTHMIDVNVISWLGILVGAVFSWRYFAVKKKSFKKTFMIGLTALVAYEACMYFMIDRSTSKMLLSIPLFLRNFGYVTIAIVLLSDLLRVPFKYFFEALSVQTMISAACGGAIGSAIISHALHVVAPKNFQNISMSFDKYNPALQQHSEHLPHLLQQQVLLVSLKELYGYFLIFGIIFWLLMLCYRNPYLANWFTKQASPAVNSEPVSDSH